MSIVVPAEAQSWVTLISLNKQFCGTFHPGIIFLQGGPKKSWHLFDCMYDIQFRSHWCYLWSILSTKYSYSRCHTILLQLQVVLAKFKKVLVVPAFPCAGLTTTTIVKELGMYRCSIYWIKTKLKSAWTVSRKPWSSFQGLRIWKISSER